MRQLEEKLSRYPNQEVMVILSRELYYQLLRNEASLIQMDAKTITQFIFGKPLRILDIADMSDTINVMTMRDWNAYTKKRCMFHRLITNGEAAAAGKSKKARKEIIREEARGFAEMCEGYDHWEILAKQYLELNPEGPPDDLIVKTFDSKTESPAGRWGYPSTK